MAERRHISNVTWNEHQRAVGGCPVVERINFAREKATEFKNKVRTELITIGGGSAGLILGSGALEYYNVGPQWLKVGMLAIGALDALCLPITDRLNRAQKRDWEEITNREIAVSRPEIAVADRTLARAIYEGELQMTTADEVANLKQVLDHLRDIGLIGDGINPAVEEADNKTQKVYQTETNKKLATLGEKSVLERKKALGELLQKGNGVLNEVKGLSIFSSLVSGGSAVLGVLGELPKMWSIGISGFFAASVGGQVMHFQEQRAESKRLKELLSREEMVEAYPPTAGDEVLARTVYDLDLHPTEEQLKNLKKLLDSLRKQNILSEPNTQIQS